MGHIINTHGIQPDQAKIEDIEKLKRPTTKTETRTFLGMLNYFRKYMPSMSRRMAPLYNLTKQDQPEVVQWTKECEKAWLGGKNLLTTAPILIYSDYERSFEIHTEAAATAGINEMIEEILMSSNT